jgi:hypothetical protein
MKKLILVEEILLTDGKAILPDGRSVTMAEIGHNSLHHTDQEQIMGLALTFHRYLLHLLQHSSLKLR